MRSRSPKRVSLKMMAGVKNVKTARPEVIQIARTAQEYRGIALDIKRKLVVAQRRNGSLKRLASKNFVDRVDEMLISKGGRRILQGELRNFKRRPRGRRWTLDEKLFALAIYKRSPRVYRFLCKHITLPCESTLKQILQKIPLQPGISGPMMKLLKNSVKLMALKTMGSMGGQISLLTMPWCLWHKALTKNGHSQSPIILSIKLAQAQC